MKQQPYVSQELDISDRHPATQQIARWFECEHLPPGPKAIARFSHELAWVMIGYLDDGPELTAGLRKLLEAKDCFVRSLIEYEEAHGRDPMA